MKKLFSALAICLSATAHAGPNINVGTVYDFLDSDKSTYLKRVFNNGESTAFVRVNVLEITFDDRGASIETPINNTHDDTSKREGLIASPTRLIVPPKAKQATRLFYKGARDVERYYRLRFVPVMPEKEDQFEVSDSDREIYNESMAAGVNILTGYGTVFFVRPTTTVFDTKITDGLSNYDVKNEGNSTIVLDNFRECEAKKTDKCSPMQKYYIRPGNSYNFTKQPGQVYFFALKEASVSKDIEVLK